jgi:hypothetical protein
MDFFDFPPRVIELPLLRNAQKRDKNNEGKKSKNKVSNCFVFGAAGSLYVTFVIVCFTSLLGCMAMAAA